MAKRIGFLILSAAIIVVGIVAFNRLHYWERSVRIFTMRNEQSSGRSYDRHRGNFGDGDRHERFERLRNHSERDNFQNLPDSVRQKMLAGRNTFISSDSLNEGRLQNSSSPAIRENFRNRSFERGGRHGRSDFHRGNQIQLVNVTLFLAVFALFTVATIYLEKVYKLIRRKQLKTINQPEK